MLGIPGNHYPSYLLKHHVAFIALLSFCIMTLTSRRRPPGATDAWRPPQGCASVQQNQFRAPLESTLLHQPSFSAHPIKLASLCNQVSRGVNLHYVAFVHDKNPTKEQHFINSLFCLYFLIISSLNHMHCRPFWQASRLQRYNLRTVKTYLV